MASVGICLALLLGSSAHPPVVYYLGPPSSGGRAGAGEPVHTAHVSFTLYGSGEEAYAATDRVRLREAPRADSREVSTVPFGSSFSIVRRSSAEPEIVGGRVDHWYQVRHESGAVGFVFGAALTPVLLRLAGPNGSSPVLATVSWGWNFDVCLRLFRDGRESVACLPSRGTRRGGAARAFVLNAGGESAAGPLESLVLLEVESTSGDAPLIRRYHAYRVNAEAPREIASTYAHTHAGGVHGYLLFEPGGERVCTGIAPARPDVCRRLSDGTRVELPTDFAKWTRVPAAPPQGSLLPARSMSATPAPPCQARGKTPGSLYIQKGVCPGECCTYREWTATTTVNVVDKPGSQHVVAKLAPDEKVEARTGEVHVVPLRACVAREYALESTPSSSAKAPTLKPGTVFWVLAPTGEGYATVWVEDKLYVGEILCLDPTSKHEASCWAHIEDGDPPKAFERWRNHRWWVHVRTGKGLSGWVDNTEGVLTGFDACG